MSPHSILLGLVLVSSFAIAADPPSTDPPQPDPDPIALAESADAGTVPPLADLLEQATPSHEARHAAPSYEDFSLDDSVDGVSGALVEEETAGAVCKQYGEVCRRTRQCCAPLHCAFDGYVYYCRY
jgi:hypothetical protein